jgi:hypothetical protein
MSEQATATCQSWFLDQRCRLVPGVWSYDATDPLAVTLVLSPSGGATRRWTWARSLLAEAFSVPCGEGDVHLYRSALDRLVVCLSAPEGDCQLSCLAEPAREFLMDTVEACLPCRGGRCGPCSQCTLVRQALDIELAGILRGTVS